MTLLVFILTFLLKFILSFLPSFEVDMGTWISWAGRLSELGPGSFYSDTLWTQYTPGFFYWLWPLGKLGLASPLSIKLPAILAEVGTAVFIWSILKRVDKKFAFIAFFLYALNPVVIFDSSVWGQIDGILALLLFSSLYFLTLKEKPALSGLLWGLAFLVKPQAIALLPAVVFIFYKNFSLKRIFSFLLPAVLGILLLSFPFFPTSPVLGLPQLVAKMGEFYSYTSVFAFNFWSFIGGMWRPDSELFLGVSLFVWGFILYVVSIIFLFLVFKKKEEVGHVYLFAALSLMAFFLFPTRVHERYIFPALPFLLTAAGLLKSRKILFSFLGVTALSFINFYHPYAYYSENFLARKELLSFTGSLAPLVGVGFIVIFLGMLSDWKFPQVKMKGPRLSAKLFLFIVLAFSFLTRVLFLGNPEKEYFDEVYHAFTAREVLHGQVEPWEWWNTPPEGYAFEWTHPPLAKLGMVLGMLAFGENSFGWRIPGALLGVGSTLLVFLIAKKIFKDEGLGILAAGVFSLDGLALVMSRIGMNDSYLLFFVLLCFYLFLKDKYFFSALALGLALSSKWSAVWVLPILFLSHLVLKKKIKISYLWFLLVPPLVYLSTYIPMFLTNHGLDIFWGMQKQMWWYHTNLEATHPYTSPWWSWPFLARPIYLYTSEEVGGMVARIYAMGNPLVFWMGFVSLFYAIYYAIKEKGKTIGLIIFSYLIFFVPWAASPRIMFLYHYLPSIPFLTIVIAYVLKRNKKFIVPALALALIGFIYFYPHFTGIKIPLELDRSYYWFPAWR